MNFKIENFRTARQRHAASGSAASGNAAPGSVAPTPSNDNTFGGPCAARPRRTRRPKLVCRWRPLPGGGLECRWNPEQAEGAATEEPDPRWITGCISRLIGGRMAGRRRAVSASA
jgi:hypothetical protein